MNQPAASQRFDDPEDLLRSALEQIIATPPPMDRVERVMAWAVRLSLENCDVAEVARLPKSSQRNLGEFHYLILSGALALAVLIAVGFVMFGEWPREKPIAGPPKGQPIEPVPKLNPTDTVTPPAEVALNSGMGVTPPTEVAPDKRLGASQSGGLGFGANAAKRGGASAAGASPSRWFSVASEATILVSTGGKAPIQLGEKQAFTRDTILHVWEWSKSDKSRPLGVSSPSFAVSPDGKWIVTINGEKIELATGKVSPLADFASQPHKMLFSRDGQRIALLLDGKENTATFRIIEFPKGEKLCEIENQWPAMLPAVFSPDGSEIFLMGKDNFVRRFDVTTGKELQKYEPAHENSVRAMVASPSGKLLVSGGSRGDILLWEVDSGKLLHKLVVEPAVYADAGVYSLAFSPDEKQVVGGGIGSLVLWSMESGTVKQFPRGSAGAEHIRFSADGRAITAVRGFSGTSGPAGENLLVYPSMSKWDVAEAK